MPYGICHLSIAPVRKSPEDAAEMSTQLLYGVRLKIVEGRKHWSRVRNIADASEGWVCNHQFHPLSQEDYQNSLEAKGPDLYCTDLVSFTSNAQGILIPILLGSTVSHARLLNHTFEGNCGDAEAGKSNLINTALLYLNAPFLSGGKTPFGIDSAGFTQMVYRMNGIRLERTASGQATQGDALSFIEESEAGDLAFCDNREGVIDHVGIIMKDNHIIHAHGMVRIDRLDHTGIFNTDRGRYSHSLRVIKKIV